MQITAGCRIANRKNGFILFFYNFLGLIVSTLFGVTVSYSRITSNLYFYNGDTLLYTASVADGGNGVYEGVTPSKASTAQYNYTFSGWSRTADGAYDSTALNSVTTDRSVYAVFSSSVRTYTVTFKNDTRTVYTAYNIPYGGSAEYEGSTPVSTADSSWEFTGWNPRPSGITGDTVCYAVYDTGVEVAEISDSWSQIIASACDNTYRNKYKLGNHKDLDLGVYGIMRMQIVGFDADTDEDGNTLPMTFLSTNVTSTAIRMGPDAAVCSYANYPLSDARITLNTTVLQCVPSGVREYITPCAKVNYAGENDKTVSHQTTYEFIFIPSEGEIKTYSDSLYKGFFLTVPATAYTLDGTAVEYPLRDCNGSYFNYPGYASMYAKVDTAGKSQKGKQYQGLGRVDQYLRIGFAIGSGIYVESEE